MESFYTGTDPSDQDSRQYRSRSNSHLSSTAEHFQGLAILDPSNTSGLHSLGEANPLHSHKSPEYLNQERRSPSIPFIPAPVPQQSSTFPILTQEELDWTFHQVEGQERTGAPIVRLDPVQLDEQSERRDSNTNLATMSTVGIQQYDSRFDAGFPGVRPSFTWPNFDMHVNQHFFPNTSGQALSQGALTPFDDPKLMPLYARSLSSSPPRVGLTAEQRELKRQRDHARRDSKTRVRRERSTSNPYVISQNASPDILPGPLPEYTSSLTPSPLLSQNSPSLGSTSYLPTYSPSLAGDVSSDIYGPVYSMGPNDFTSTPAYSMPYSNPEPILESQNFLPRPHSLSSASASSQQHYQNQALPSQQHQQRISPVTATAKLDSSGEHVRVVHSRPKPQCWEHGCNGRQFSTFSNLLRHQREKSGAAAKSSCPNCGAEFTRTTARNGHMAHEKCKQRRNS